MADERDIIQRIESVQRNWYGDGDFNADASVERFSLQKPELRAEILDGLAGEMDNLDTTDLRRYSQITGLRTRLRHVNDRLRKAGR